MTQAELLNHFRACQRYKAARRWQKPWINPRRFVTNQLRIRGLYAPARGELRAVPTFHFPQFIIVNGEAVSEQIASYGIYEENLTEAFLRLVQPEQIVVDIGMHLGYYTTLFALLVGRRGQVHAFEPTPSTREVARHNVQPFSQVTVHPHAVWSAVQTIPFHDYGSEWMAFNSFTDAKIEKGPPPAKEIQVETITLDRFRQTLGKKISLIKIDAESAEKEILAGAEQLLKMDQPIVTLEVGDVGGRPTSRRLVQCLIALGYTPWELQAGRFERHPPREIYAYDNLIFAPAAQDLSPF